MIDTLRNDKYYKRYMYLGKLVATGYAPVGPVSFGPVATFVSFNRVEGLNLRMGMETNENLSSKVKWSGYLSRAFDTERWKFSTGLTFAFNESYNLNPRHFLRLTAERESSFPGQNLEFFSPDNFLLSFQRGDATKMIFTDTYEALYVEESYGFNYSIALQHEEV